MRVASVLVGVLAMMGAACAGDESATATTVTVTVGSSVAVATTSAPETTQPDRDDAEMGADTAATTAPATSEPEVTVPATTAAPTTAPVAPTVPTTEPIEDAPSAEYCASAADLYTINAAGDAADDLPPALFESLLALFAITAQDMQAVAPSEALAQDWLAFLLALGTFDEISAEGGYDVAAIEELPRFDELMDLGAVIESYLDANEGYVVDVCGESLEDLDQAAIELLAFLQSDSDGTADLTTVTDDTGRIRVDVPRDWEVEGLELDDSIQLVAARDLESFYTGWVEDGVSITAWDVAPGTADAASRLSAASAPTQCELVSTEPYSDVLYTGELRYFTNCDGAEVSAFVLTVTDFDSAVEVLVEGQFVDPDSTLPQAIFDSFLVDAAS